MMKKFWISLLMPGLFAGLMAADAGTAQKNRQTDPVPAGPPRMHGPRMHRAGGNMYYWRVFNRMSEEERRSMMELQAKDPAAFQQQMKQRIEALQKADAAMKQKIDDLARRCRTGSEAEKQAAREELTKIFREGFRRRLADSRRHLQEMQKRMQKLAESLEKKEANAEQEIRKIVDDCIQGRRPEKPPRHRERMAPPPPDMMPPPPPQKE